MFSDMTFETILREMLERTAAEFPGLDTREGSLIYSALAPAAVELGNLYLALDTALEMSYADTAARDYLVRRCAERGITPYGATHAVVEAEFSPTDVAVAEGTRFRGGGAVFAVSGRSPSGYPLLTCETAGSVGNVSGGALVPIGYIAGLRSAVIRALSVPGRDEEDTEALRRRYLDSLQAQAFGGNIADYRDKVLSIDGVGGVRVFPVPDGPGTVGICLIGADMEVPSDTLISLVQETLDPESSGGEGRGLAPIGHRVTVDSVSPLSVAVTTSLTLVDGANLNTVVTLAEEALARHFYALRTAWGGESVTTVRVSRVDTQLLDVEGVLDVSGTRLNGQSGNLALSETQAPFFGGLTAG